MGSHVQGPRPRDRVGSFPVVCDGKRLVWAAWALGPETCPRRSQFQAPFTHVGLPLVRRGCCRFLKNDEGTCGEWDGAGWGRKGPELSFASSQKEI